MGQLTEQDIYRIARRVAGSGSGGRSGYGGGGVSQGWVEENFVNKDFFNQLFIVHGTRTYTDDEGVTHTDDVVVTPNQLTNDEYTINNIEVNTGLWTKQYVSALGLNPDGGSSGASSLGELVDVTLTNPANGDLIMYDGTKWVNIPQSQITPDLSGYATQLWVQQQGYLTPTSLNGYATQAWVQGRGYLTQSSLMGYATQTWVNAQGFLKEVTGTFWGQSWSNGNDVVGTLDYVDSINMSGTLRIGDGMITWDSTNNGFKLQKADGTAAGLYATGFLSALGLSQGSGTVDAMTFGNVTVNNTLTIAGSSVYQDGNDYLVLDGKEGIKLANDIDTDGFSVYTRGGNINTAGGKIYLDATRYIYVSGSTLYYYNGSTIKTIAFTN